MVNRWRLFWLTRDVARQAQVDGDQKPVIFFNASARIHGLSLNAAFQLLAAWGLRLSGIPVVHFVCQAGMSRCVLGTNRDDASESLPCAPCVAQSKRLYRGADVRWFSFDESTTLVQSLLGLSLDELCNYEHEGVPYGEIVLPSLRWILRRHHLEDNEANRFLLRQYILSAYRVGQEFAVLLDKVKPSTVVVFNGIMYPEAMAKRVAEERGIHVITHEVAFQPFSTFFTDGEATAYPIEIPEEFELSTEQNTALDAYLSKRFQGDFTMAGIRFWPEMRELDEGLIKKIEAHKHLVPVFTNVIFDTSQVHANTVFPHMFAWLDQILETIKGHPETLFVIRAHPDEMRPGTQKAAREHVAGWVEKHGVVELPNVVFIGSEEYISSYALIRRAKFVMVYNSSIGLEATLLGAPVLCGGKARFTQYPAVFFPQSEKAYKRKAEEFLEAKEIDVPDEFMHNARRFLYYQNWRTALSFEDFLQAHPRKGFVRLKAFDVQQLRAKNSKAVRVIRDGIVNDGSFLV